MDYLNIRRVLEAFDKRGVHYVVFGGVALNLLGLARATEDLDVFIEPTEENVERVRLALDDVFDDPNLREIRSEDLLGEYPAVQYVPPEGAFHIDLLTRLGEVFSYEDLEWEIIEFDGLEIPVVTPVQLHRMKKDTVRLQDRADAERLRDRFGLKEDE